MSVPVREPGDGPSKDGPLNYEPKEVRHPEPEPDPNPAGAPPKADAAPQRPEPPESTEPPWKRPKQRAVFAGDVAIAELRARLALAPDRLPEPPPPASPGLKHVLARRLAGVAVVTVVGVIGYQLGSAPPASPPRPALPSGQSNQQGLASKRSVAYPPQSAELAFRSPGAEKAIVLQTDEQKLRDAASARAMSQQLTVGAVRPRHADDAAMLTFSAKPPKHDAAEIALMMKSGAALMANGDISAARLMYQSLAEEGEAMAAIALAETYDPLVLRKSKIAGGITPDVALAQSWYEKAKALGSAVALERIERLARLPE